MALPLQMPIKSLEPTNNQTEGVVSKSRYLQNLKAHNRRGAAGP